ncbi:hypothetical protein O6R08_02570 [Cutibacterium equinum]|uniref:Uncharacterized protein n=1 Tax=Cutibacterium equinum TaxID=3016342 RepID=A0ABY7QZF1_9ACTN|nr:hypothetical protein [Cutibacterium equinum]WCC80426.1 hypothetical protein O6R08_02570 [Cutibacterium equinum]
MMKLKAAFARDHLRGLAATKEVSFMTAALAVAAMVIVPRSVSVISFVAVIAMITWYVTRRLLQGAEREGSTTVREQVRYCCDKTWQETKSKAKRFFTLAAPGGWREVRITADSFDNAVSMSTVIWIIGVIYIAIVVVVLVATFASFAGVNDAILSAVFSAAISYNMLAISCLLTVSAFCCIAFLSFLRRIAFLQSHLGVGSCLRCIATWIGYGGAVGAVMASLVPLAGLVVTIPTQPAKSAAILNAITPRSMLDYPAAGAVAGYAFGLIVAIASLFPDSKNSWLRRVLCPGLFVVVFIGLSHFRGGPRGLLRPVIDAAALQSGFSSTFCTGAAPTDIASGSIGAKAWVITAMDRCGGGLLISTSAIGWVVGIAAFLVGGSLFISDICGRARSEE